MSRASRARTSVVLAVASLKALARTSAVTGRRTPRLRRDLVVVESTTLSRTVGAARRRRPYLDLDLEIQRQGGAKQNQHEATSRNSGRSRYGRGPPEVSLASPS